MINSIIMKSRPRRTGKTEELKLLILEENYKYDKVVYIHTSAGCDRLYRYFSDLYQHDTITDSFFDKLCISNLSNFSIIFRGVSNKKILLVIDEPYLFPENKQIELLNEIESSRITFDIIGIGTLPDQRLFRDFIKGD